MAVGEASLGLGLPGVASVVKQYRLSMVLECFFQLGSGFSMKGLGRQERLAGNGCIGLGHGVALLGCQQNTMYWEMAGLYAAEQTTPLSATTGMGGFGNLRCPHCAPAAQVLLTQAVNQSGSSISQNVGQRTDARRRSRDSASIAGSRSVMCHRCVVGAAVFIR
jgi:hypothetical protein